jgi:F-type H+-transporting ATPase subunit alpha
MEVFAQFGADLDRATRDKLAQGERLIETLKQPVSQPMDLARQVLTLFTATGDAVMDIPVSDIRRFNDGFYNYVLENNPHIVKRINETGVLSKDDENNLSAAEHVFIDAFGGV